LRCAIGMKQSIAQESARQFAIAFYDSVFSGRDYGASFRIGKTAIQSQYDAFKPHLSGGEVDLEEPIRQPVLLSPEQLEKQELQKEYEKLQRKYQLISEQISGELNEDNQDTLRARKDSIKRKMNDIFNQM
jgi:Effector-associated domain 9